VNNDMEARAIRALLDIIMRPKESDYTRSTNGLVAFDDKPAAARVNELARLGYDREWNK
jgi:hypothetical protein